MYIGTDHSVYAAVIRPKIDEMCKKKSPLRTAFEWLNGKYSARLNYGVASPWLKIHEKNIQSAVFGRDGIRLIVAKGMIELDLRPTAATIAYAEAVQELLSERVIEENLLYGPHVLGSTVPIFDVLVVDAEQAVYREHIDLDSPATQMKFKPGMLPGGDCEVRVYADPNGGQIVRITTDDPTLHVDQYFRVLPIGNADLKK
jgi:hypothetical protein